MASYAVADFRYKDALLWVLLLSTFTPTIIGVTAYAIYGESFSNEVMIISLVVILSGTHPWITLAYYFDGNWRLLFNKHPTVFYGVPLLILLSIVLVVGAAPLAIGWSFIFLALALNVWHHSRQNWGILVMASKARGVDIGALRLPIIWGWPFFIIALGRQYPNFVHASEFVGVSQSQLDIAANACAFAYQCWFAFALTRCRGAIWRDPFIVLLVLGIAIYFLPSWLWPGYSSIIALGAGHGFQYYALVLLSLTMRERSLTLSDGVQRWAVILAMLVAITLFGHILRELVANGGGHSASGSLRYVLGLVYAVPLIHFWIDAFIWKFSNAEIRNQHGEAFRF